MRRLSEAQHLRLQEPLGRRQAQVHSLRFWEHLSVAASSTLPLACLQAMVRPLARLRLRGLRWPEQLLTHSYRQIPSTPQVLLLALRPLQPLTGSRSQRLPLRVLRVRVLTISTPILQTYAFTISTVRARLARRLSQVR